MPKRQSGCTWLTEMHILFIFLFISISITSGDCLSSKDQCPNVKTSLASVRKRRHLTFPEGSAVSVTVSCTKTFLTHVPSGWYSILEVDVIYHLPDAKFTNAQWRRKLHHRQKREFWERIQSAIDFHNLNGRACVLRGICEGRKLLAPPGKSLVHDILRTIFTAPTLEDDFNYEISDSYRELLEPNFCDQIHECPFSLMDFVLSLNKSKH